MNERYVCTRRAATYDPEGIDAAILEALAYISKINDCAVEPICVTTTMTEFEFVYGKFLCVTVVAERR